mmetsp:Transcript_113742/g.307062  ORF Transcript_113742/g.307062 Transcript_113742/m.307062 type:complete len:214 (-) Transcript_113742:64-705(-)
MSCRRAAAVVLLCLLILPEIGRAQQQGVITGSGLCADGQCINCMHCDGDCFDSCTCYDEINTCCCSSPPGYYAYGYEKIPCPGGTYQDDIGSTSCKACSASTAVLFRRNYRGAIDQMDCDSARCTNQCGPAGSNATCESLHCSTAPTIVAKMNARPPDLAFCKNFDARIPDSACSWFPDSSAPRRALSAAGPGIALLLAVLASSPASARHGPS